MNLAEVKDLIKSLVVAANGRCTIQQLLVDFEEECGFPLPSFNFYVSRGFLLTLTDIIKVVGIPSNEYVTLAIPNDSPTSYTEWRDWREWRQGGRKIFPDFSTRNNYIETAVQRYDINIFIKGYQMGRVTLNEAGGFERVNDIYGVMDEDDEDIEDMEFLFTDDGADFLEDTEARRATVYDFLGRIGYLSEADGIFDTVGHINYPLPYTSASDEVIASLQDFMKFQNCPIPSRKLFHLYFEFSGSPLDYEENGFRSLIEMVRSLKQVFRCMRQQNGEWLLFDASHAPEDDEMEMYSLAFSRFPSDIQDLIIWLLESHCEITSEPGIPVDDFLALYYKKYRTKLNFTRYGFPDFKSLLSKLNGKILKVEDFGQNVIVKPLIERSRLGRRKIFSITPGDNVFPELFPIDCIGYGAEYPEMKLDCYFKIGRKIRVNVAEVYSPNKFYIRLKKFQKELRQLMSKMHLFYKYQENKYRMPEPTIRLNQICAVCYFNGRTNGWYRSIITSVPDKEHVVVYLVDYGVKTRLSSERIRFLHRDFYCLPMQAFVARIYNIKPLERGSWPLNVNSYFQELISRPFVLFRAMRYDEKAKRLLGEVFIMENDRHLSVSTKLFRESMVAKRLDDREPVLSSDDDNVEPCSQVSTFEGTLVPVVQNPPEESSTSSASSETESVDLQNNDDLDENPRPAAHGTLNEAWPEMVVEEPDHRARERQLRAEWTWEKEVNASAFSLLSSAEWLQDIAQDDIERGLAVARTLAEEIVYELP